MDLGLADRTFVVGGGGGGLGRAAAEALVADGARVLLLGRSEARLRAAIGELGARAQYATCDITQPESVLAAAEHACGLGPIHGVLVNGGGPPAGDVLELRDAQWQEALALLVTGPVTLLRALRPALSDDASLLFVTSSSVRQPIAGLDTSNVLRPGVAAMVKTLARQLAPMRVNSIAPGRFSTERVRSLDERRAAAQGIDLSEQQLRTSKTIPLGRYGEPIELGRVAAFLLSPAAGYLTGTAVQVDGGLVTAVP